jgi:hypothetical protein
MLCTAKTSFQFRLYGYSHTVSFKICVHILPGITVYFDTPSDLVDSRQTVVDIICISYALACLK